MRQILLNAASFVLTLLPFSMEQGIAPGDPSAGGIRTALVESPPIADLVAPPFEKASARGWTQTLKEDFNDTTLNKCWKTSYEGGVHTLAANEEEEWYVSPEAGGRFSPFHLSNGLLEIAAVTSASQPHSDAHGHPYLSGMIMSDGCFSQTYGYFEMRTKLPSGKGLWPAFWLLPSSHKWPPEIDVFEMFGASNSRHEGGLGWIHTGTVGAGTSAFNNWHKVNIDQYATFHRYGLLWGPRTMSIYVDGERLVSQSTPPAFHQPMYVIANLAVGGRWPESPDATTEFPAVMHIDYTHVWQYKEWRGESK